jgi:hypothetical protein
MDDDYYASENVIDRASPVKLIDMGVHVFLIMYTVIHVILLSIFWYNNMYTSHLLLVGLVINLLVIIYSWSVFRRNKIYKLTVREKVGRSLMLVPMIIWSIVFATTSISDKIPLLIVITTVVYITIIASYTLYWICYNIAGCLCCGDHDSVYYETV